MRQGGRSRCTKIVRFEPSLIGGVRQKLYSCVDEFVFRLLYLNSSASLPGWSTPVSVFA